MPTIVNGGRQFTLASKNLNLCSIFARGDFDCSSNGECDNRENMSEIYTEYHRTTRRYFISNNIGDAFLCHATTFPETSKHNAFDGVCSFDL